MSHLLLRQLTVLIFYLPISHQLLEDGSLDCFSYQLQNECQNVVNYTSLTPEKQLQVFESLKWNISDIRMFPASCRRAILWCWCGSFIPSCQVNEITSIFTCETVCTQTVPMECGFSLDNASLPPYQSGQLTKEVSCVEFDLNKSIPVVTCLPEGISCCTGMFDIDPNTNECNVVCVRIFDSDEEAVIEVLMLILVWTSVGLVLFGCIPFVLDDYARSFPNHIPLFIATFSTCFTIVPTVGIFGNPYEPGSYTCDNHSNACIWLGVVFSFFGLMLTNYANWLCYRVVHSCYSSYSIVKSFPFISQKASHLFLVHGSTLFIALISTGSLLIIAYLNDSYVTITVIFAEICYPSVDFRTPHFYTFHIVFLVCSFVLILQTLLIFVGFLRSHYVLVLSQLRAALICF